MPESDIVFIFIVKKNLNIWLLYGKPEKNKMSDISVMSNKGEEKFMHAFWKGLKDDSCNGVPQI